jgi:ABC-type phosphate transport system permease subunit
MSEPIATLKITFDDISDETKTQIRQFLQLCSFLMITTIVYIFLNIMYKTYQTFRQIKYRANYNTNLYHEIEN